MLFVAAFELQSAVLLKIKNACFMDAKIMNKSM